MNKLTSNKTNLIQPFEATIKALKLTLPNRKSILAIVLFFITQIMARL